MSKALIGHTGFVGGNLASQVAFDATYNSTNIEAIRGQAYELVVCAGAPGAKWKANKDPEGDRASIERLMSCLASVSADHAVLISTVDVYPDPIGVNEQTAIRQDHGSPYGRLRLLLEHFVAERFESTIVRLPALFGPGLKKNAIYDILHNHQPEKICQDSVFQFYPTLRLWSDIEMVRSHKLRLVNFATEPMSMPSGETGFRSGAIEFHYAAGALRHEDEIFECVRQVRLLPLRAERSARIAKDIPREPRLGPAVKLAISNIAWPREQEPRVADLMVEHGLAGVEVAPTMVWDRPFEATDRELQRYRDFWNRRGIQIVALQALLFGRDDLKLFEDEQTRSRLLEHLRGMIRLGARLGARVLVFGAPKNRWRGTMPEQEADETAVSFFKAAGEAAAEYRVTLCIEPNPVEYGCDFVTDSEQGLELVKKVASPGFGLHLDAAAMTLAAEVIETRLSKCSDALRHFHASEPFLGSLGQGGVSHDHFASVLRDHHYSNWVSVEMRHDPETELVPSLTRTLTYLERVYGSASGIVSNT